MDWVLCVIYKYMSGTNSFITFKHTQDIDIYQVQLKATLTAINSVHR